MHSSAALRGLMPETENPPPKESEDIETPTVPTDISTEEFHERADEFLEDLVTRLETAQDKLTDVDVEYSVRSHANAIVHRSQH
jgi:frataxin